MWKLLAIVRQHEFYYTFLFIKQYQSRLGYHGHNIHTIILHIFNFIILGAITNTSIKIDQGHHLELVIRDDLQFVIEGITTGAQATSVTWRWNGSIVNSQSRPAGGGLFFEGVREAIVGVGPCEDQRYRVTLQVMGYLPGTYTYTVSNADTPTPVTSPLLLVQGR